MSEALRLFITNTGPRSRLDVGGEIDLATIDALEDHLALLIEAGTGDIEVDMAAVTFCDATVLGVLLAAHRTLHASGRRFQIINPSPSTIRLLRLADLDDTALLAAQPSDPRPRMQFATTACRNLGPTAGGRTRPEGAEDADRQTHHRPLR
jgi:anti-anti-sigma factor